MGTKKFFCLSLLSTGAISLSLLTSTASAQDKLVAASDVGYQPFSSAKPAGGFEGIDIDIADAISRQLGIKIEVIDQPWATTFAGLNAKKFDMVLAPAVVTKERAEQLLFSQGHGDATYQFVLRKNGPQINSADDLKKKVVAVNKGNIFDKWLTARQEQYGLTINRFDKNSDAIQAVASGQADAAMVYSAVAGYVSKQSPVLATSKYLVDEGGVYGYAFRKDDAATRDKVDMAIQCLKKDGTLVAIYRKWTGLEPLPTSAMLKVSAGTGQPGFAGHDPTPRNPSCK